MKVCKGECQRNFLFRLTRVSVSNEHVVYFSPNPSRFQPSRDVNVSSLTWCKGCPNLYLSAITSIFFGDPGLATVGEEQFGGSKARSRLCSKKFIAGPYSGAIWRRRQRRRRSTEDVVELRSISLESPDYSRYLFEAVRVAINFNAKYAR